MAVAGGSTRGALDFRRGGRRTGPARGARGYACRIRFVLSFVVGVSRSTTRPRGPARGFVLSTSTGLLLQERLDVAEPVSDVTTQGVVARTGVLVSPSGKR